MTFEYTTLRERTLKFALIETTVITVLDFLLCFLFHRQDIFFLSHGAIPWMLFGPLLIGLLYGLPYASASHFILLAAGLALSWPVDLSLLPSFQYYFFGSTLLVLVCGQFGSYWKLRMEHIEQLNKYLRERIDYLTRAYYLNKVSHDMIEQQFISRPFSLRSTFHEIREMLILHKGELSAAVTHRFLELAALYLQIESAQIYWMESDQLNSTPAASIGRTAHMLQKDDPLIQLALKNKLTNFVSIAEFDDRFKSAYIVAAPIVTSQEKILGILTIDDIAYRSLNHPSLEKLMVFLSYFANMKLAIEESKMILEKYPTCPMEFGHELIQLNRLKVKYQVDSFIVCVEIDDIEKAPFYLDNLHRQKRNLDVIWQLKLEKKFAFIVLMPFSDAQSVLSYIARIKKFFKVTYNIELNDATVYFRYLKLSEQGFDTTLTQLMSEIE